MVKTTNQFISILHIYIYIYIHIYIYTYIYIYTHRCLNYTPPKLDHDNSSTLNPQPRQGWPFSPTRLRKLCHLCGVWLGGNGAKPPVPAGSFVRCPLEHFTKWWLASVLFVFANCVTVLFWYFQVLKQTVSFPSCRLSTAAMSQVQGEHLFYRLLSGTNNCYNQCTKGY